MLSAKEADGNIVRSRDTKNELGSKWNRLYREINKEE